MKVQSTMQNKLLRYKWALILFSIFTVTNAAYAQNCDCESAFLWVKQTFEENDAGFQYVIDKKGIPEYEKHNAVFLEKVRTAKNNNECANYINDWLFFFRKGHIGILVLKNNDTTREDVKTFPDWEKVDIDTVTFKKYLDAKKELDFEGIWLDSDSLYAIGIKNIDDQQIGFIIQSKAKEWLPGQIKFRIYPDSAIYYMRDHSEIKIKRTKLISPNWLLFDSGFNFFRDYPKQEDKFLESSIYNKPYMEQISEHTLYLRIPSFPYESDPIDSVILTNKEKIHATENLIIDLRFNGGGSDNAWNNLLPIIYTNPIRQKSCYILSTKMNNQRAKEYRSKVFYNKLNNHLGEFVPLFSEKYFTDQFDTIYENPKNIAVIVDENCASSTEQFLLACKQSKKVKIFGRVTSGQLDFSNLNSVESPCNDFRLYYATSKDVDIDDYPIDGIGIQPDFYLDDDIPEYKWVEYVNDILNYQ